MGTTTATAILPLLLSPPLDVSLGLMVLPDVDEGDGDDVASVAGFVGVEVSVLIEVAVEVAGPGVELVSVGGGVLLLGVGGGVLEVVSGGGDSLVDDVVGGGGGGELDEEVVVGGGGGGVVDVDVGGGGGVLLVVVLGGAGLDVDDVGTSPPGVSVLFDMAKAWRFSRGKFLYGIDMSVRRRTTRHD
jgi:hypothetical protein